MPLMSYDFTRSMWTSRALRVRSARHSVRKDKIEPVSPAPNSQLRGGQGRGRKHFMAHAALFKKAQQIPIILLRRVVFFCQ